MKMMRSLLITGAVIMITMLFSGVHAQEPGPGHNTHPDAKWEVRKEYDEQGNLIYYDSSYIQTWKNFKFPDDMFENHPFTFFPDSLFTDDFMPFEEFFPHSFHGPDVFFDRHKEWIEKFR